MRSWGGCSIDLGLLLKSKLRSVLERAGGEGSTVPGLPGPGAALAPGATPGPEVLYSSLRHTEGQAEPLRVDRGHSNETYTSLTMKKQNKSSL